MDQRSQSRASKGSNERGNVLAYTVLSALFLFLAVGLGVDLSHLYLAKTELQNAADAAALAGASALKLPIDDPSTNQPYRIPTAVDRALLTLNQNKYNFDNRDFAAVMNTAAQRALVRFAVNLSEFDNGGNGRSEATAIGNPDDIRFIRVITPTVPVTVFFAAPILGSTQSLDARAVSGLSVPGNTSFCIAPLSAIQCDPGNANCTLDDPNNPCDPNNPVTCKYWGKCPGAPGTEHDIQTLTKLDANGQTITYTCDPKREFCKKCTYVIRAEGANSQGPAAGNYQVLRCAGAGADVVRQALAEYGTNCRCGNVTPGGDIDTQTGVLGGPVGQGLNVRFDCFQGNNGPQCGGGTNLSYSTNMPPDSNIAYGSIVGNGQNQTFTGVSRAQYLGTQVSPEPAVPAVTPNASHPGVDDRRVLILPIVPVSEWLGQNGAATVTVGGIGAFFMRHPVGGGNGGDIAVEYMGDDIVSVIGYDPNDTNTTNIVTPVLYR